MQQYLNSTEIQAVAPGLCVQVHFQPMGEETFESGGSK